MFAVQLALRRGAWVIATASSRNLPFLRRLGAHEAIDHAVSNLEQAVKRVDVVLDLVGREAQDRCWKILKNGAGWFRRFRRRRRKRRCCAGCGRRSFRRGRAPMNCPLWRADCQR